MLIDSLTPKEIEKLQGTLDIVEEQDEYAEYNNKLEETSYIILDMQDCKKKSS